MSWWGRACVGSFGRLLRPAGRRFTTSLAQAADVQAALARQLIADHRHTAYGNDHGLGDLKGPAGARGARGAGGEGLDHAFEDLPVVEWNDLLPYLEREQAGEARALCPHPVRFFEPTSGSGGPKKHVPYTAPLLGSFRHMFAVWMADLLEHGPRLETGHFYFSVSPRLASGEDEPGTPGTEDDDEYLSGFMRLLLRPFMVRPDLGRGALPPDEFRLRTVRALLADPKLEVISVWHPSFLEVLLDFVEADRNLTGGQPFDPALCWPQLKVVSCWADGGAHAGAERLRQRLPGVLVQGKGLLSTEAPVTVPRVELDEQGLGQAPLVDDVVVELEGDAGGLIKLSAAQEGATYRLVVSTRGGLLRYRTGDLVEVRGRREECPLLRFAGRADEVSDLVGEKLDGSLVEAALGEAFGAAGQSSSPQSSFGVLVPDAGPPARYRLLTDLEVKDDDVEMLAQTLDQRLMEGHHYRQARLLGQLAPCAVVVDPSARDRLEKAWCSSGRKLGDLKPGPLMRVPLSIVTTLTSILALLLLAGCPPEPEPYYDEELGLEGQPVDPGALAGTFGLKMQITTQTDIPVVGLVTGGGDTYLLVERTWEDGTGYSQTQQVCGGRLRSETSTSTLPDESWRLVPAEPPQALAIADEEGRFALEGHIELWGLLRSAFDDPYTDALPEDHLVATESPHAERIIDMDEDGNPGMTISVEGLVTGDFYFVQRKISAISGVVLGPDRIVGLNETSFEQVILGASQGPVQQGFPQMKHPDPKQSWTEEIRLPDGSDCDEVLTAIEDERLSRFEPF